MSLQQQTEFIQSLDGELTPEQAAQLLELADMGDTGTEPDTGSAMPGAAPDDGTNAEAGNSEAQPTPELSADTAIILARDGKHTISYDKLVEAREGEKHWRAQAESAMQELGALKAASQARSEAGVAPTAVDNQVAAASAAIENGVDPSIFGDFSEDALAKGIATLVSQQVEARVGKALEPLHQKQAVDATKSHYDAIYTAHPDADSLAESKELSDWIGSQPSFVQAAYRQVLETGTTQDVIELFDRFKAASGAQSPAVPDPAATKAAAKAAVAKAQASVPDSLTGFPGGRPAAVTTAEAMAGMDGRQMLDAMSGMTPAQIETMLDRLG